MLPTIKLRQRIHQLFQINFYSQTIQSVHYENKKLFGAVIKSRKSKKTKQCTQDATAIHAIVTNDDDCSSEIYWLGKQNLPQEKAAPKNPIVQPHLDAIETTEAPFKPTTFKTKIKPNKQFAYIPPIAIPFTDTDLKSILDYPMVCDKIDISDQPILESHALPSVGRILQATMPAHSRRALQKWKLAKIAELGTDGFQKLTQQNFDTGSLFHRSIENFLMNKTEPEDRPELNTLWSSVQSTLGKVESRPMLSETPLIHPALKYKGVVDCVSLVQGKISVIEWKTSTKTKSTLELNYDAPVQLCAYLGALNADHRYDVRAKSGFLVVAYKNGAAADSFFMTDAHIRKYWQIWLNRLQDYWIRTRDGTLPEPI